MSVSEPQQRRDSSRRAFTLHGLVATTAAAIIVLSLTIPVLAGMRSSSGVDVSLGNLQTLGVAHAMYAFDWNGRQYTNIVDDISSYGNSATAAFANYEAVNGPHPSLLVGYGQGGALWGWHLTGNPANGQLLQPIDFSTAFGSFRVTNAKPIHDYVSGRFYSPVYYAPNDSIVVPLVAPAFDEPYEYVPLEGVPYWSSYVVSPVAQLNPAVMCSDADGGWQNPWGLDDAFTSPPLESAEYADLKTHILEHHWLQGAPSDPCNPSFDPGTYDGCEPYYFNHGLASAPATLFYDGHTRLLPTSEAKAADETLLDQGLGGTWHRGTPLGNDGYFNSAAYQSVDVSHHALTIDGIDGRDTLADVSPSAVARAKRAARTGATNARPSTRRRLPHAPFTGVKP